MIRKMLMTAVALAMVTGSVAASAQTVRPGAAVSSVSGATNRGAIARVRSSTATKEADSAIGVSLIVLLLGIGALGAGIYFAADEEGEEPASP